VGVGRLGLDIPWGRGPWKRLPVVDLGFLFNGIPGDFWSRGFLGGLGPFVGPWGLCHWKEAGLGLNPGFFPGNLLNTGKKGLVPPVW